MLTFQTIADLDQPLADELRAIITDRLTDATSIGLTDHTHITVIQPGDTEQDIEQELGWSPLVNPLTDARFGSFDFTPYWAWLQEIGVKSPSNVQCKEAGTTLRALYGPPKRVQGRDRWRAAFRAEGEYWKTDKVVIDTDDENY